MPCSRSFPTITAFVSLYGLFADSGTIQNHLALLSNVLPQGGLQIVQEQITRIAEKPGGLSVGFAAGLLIALWSANAGVKAMIDALNVIEGHDERRTFVWLNLLSLTLTLGAIGFLLAAVGAVVAFPLIMSAFGLKDVADAATWLIRWPLLLVMIVAALTVFYRFGPSRRALRRRWLTPGVMIASLAWLAGSAALSFYLSNFADYNATYGSLGAAIGLMMWMWLSAIVVLAGAQIDAVIERRPGLVANAGVAVAGAPARILPRLPRRLAECFGDAVVGRRLGVLLGDLRIIRAFRRLECRRRRAIGRRIGPRPCLVERQALELRRAQRLARRAVGGNRRADHPIADKHADRDHGHGTEPDRIGGPPTRLEQGIMHDSVSLSCNENA